jgi:sugar transferase EpsL
MYRRWGKRFLDIAIVVPAIAFLSIVLAIIALLVRLKLGSPILFQQQRPGLQGKPFTIFKFRTMTDARDSDGNVLADANRLTPFGRFLRSTSLDELPELFNVLKGDMSLVGPRPLLTRYYPYFTVEEHSRFLVRPGITGQAQVSGRNDLSWDRRIAADIAYVKEYSFWVDIRILALTAWHVIRRHGLQIDPGAIMLDFDEERRRRRAS